MAKCAPILRPSPYQKVGRALGLSGGMGETVGLGDSARRWDPELWASGLPAGRVPSDPHCLCGCLHPYPPPGRINVKNEELEAMVKEAPGPINFTVFLTMFGEKLKGE